MTVRTCLNISNHAEQRLLCIDNLSLAAALAAGLRLSSRFGAASMAMRTLVF